jgi:hypothetical protein
MYPRVLIPEGRIDFEWLGLLCDIADTGERPLHSTISEIPPFGAIVGVVPTRDSHVQATFDQIRTLRDGVFVVVDGDKAGDEYVAGLIESTPPPFAVLQWPKDWVIEDVVKWTLEADSESALGEVNHRTNRDFAALEELIVSLKNDDGRSGGLKQHYIVHEEIAGAMKTSSKCVERVEFVLEAITRAALEKTGECEHIEVDERRTTSACTIYRFRP